MKVSSRKTYEHGFVLTEGELRRITDSMLDQLKKLPSQQGHIHFTVRFHDGTVVETDELDAVLGLENSGSSQIARLTILGEDQLPQAEAHRENLQRKSSLSNQDATYLEIDFRDTSMGSFGFYPTISYEVNAQDRDWALVSCSIVDERIGRIKRLRLTQQNTKRIGAGVLALGLGAAGFLISRIIQESSKIDEIEAAWQSGKLKDPVETVLLAMKAQNRILFSPNLDLSFSTKVAILCVLGVGILSFIIVKHYYPVCNFCWGDYLDVYRRKESRGKWILGALVVGLIISFSGSLLANLWGR